MTFFQDCNSGKLSLHFHGWHDQHFVKNTFFTKKKKLFKYCEKQWTFFGVQCISTTLRYIACKWPIKGNI